MANRKDYEKILSELKSSQNEEEIIGNITKIVKGFTSEFYKNDLFENSYFRSLLFEIKDDIIDELKVIKNTLEEEIQAINNEIVKLNDNCVSSVNNLNISKLRHLKKDCILLIKELDGRLDDLDLL